jgi:tetratricopeptide (TPR) repeat protein
VALEWAFGPDGDPTIGVKLAAAASPLWLRQGWPTDCRRWALEALNDLDRRSHPTDEIDEHVALVSALTLTDGLTPEIRRNWESAYASAKHEGRREHEFTGLFLLWGYEMRNARYQAAQALLDGAGCLEAAGADAAHRAMSDWMVGRSAHCRGDHQLARERLERLVGEFTEAAGRPVLNLFGYDLESAACGVLSLTHLLLGNFDQARAASDRAVARAQALGYPLPLAHVQLWRAFLLYFLDEDSREADSLIRSIIESARTNSMGAPLAMAFALRGLWLNRSGDALRGTETTLEGLRMCSAMNYFRLQPWVAAELALQIARHGDRGAGRAADIDLYDEADAETWCTPEILRIKGEIAERTGDALAAEALYRDALTLAEHQGALTWRLRAANGLAGLWIAQKRPADAAELLAPIVNRLEPGLDQPDLRVAAHHLEVCRQARAA